jgi:hypothetical protein
VITFFIVCWLGQSQCNVQVVCYCVKNLPLLASLILEHLVTASTYDVCSHALLHLRRTGQRVLGMHGSILKEMKAHWIHMNFA